MQVPNLTNKSQEALQMAHSIAQDYGQQQIDSLHLLYALLRQNDGVIPPIFDTLNVPRTEMMNDLEGLLRSIPRVSMGGGLGQVYVTEDMNRTMLGAKKEAGKLKDEYISTEHLLLGMMQSGGNAAKLLSRYKVEYDAVLRVLAKVRGSQRVDSPDPESKYQSLEKYGTNLTQLAKQEKLDPVIGRDAEIRRVMQVLSRRTKNNPVLIGEPGTGKTAIVEGL